MPEQSSTRYLLATVARSGSSYLSDLLRHSGSAGMQGFQNVGGFEYFSAKGIKASGVDNMPPLAALETSFRASATENGVRGFKIMWPHWEALLGSWTTQHDSSALEQQEKNELVRIATQEIRWVLLERRDAIGQAVSWLRGLQTGRWHSRSTPSKSREPVYNFALLVRRLREIESHQRAWHQWFGDQGIEPLLLVYEEYVKAPQETLETIFEFIGVDPALVGAVPERGYSKQRDDLNEEWRRRYLRDSSSWWRFGMAMVRSAFAWSSWRRLFEVVGPLKPL